jgi:hypothetical protein
VAILGQDQLRREILRVPEKPGNATVSYLDLSARYALDQGLHTIVEGILYADICGAMLTQLVADHRGVSRCYRFEDFEETVRRHGGKPQSRRVGSGHAASLVAWQRFGSLQGARQQILCDCAWRTRLL